MIYKALLGQKNADHKYFKLIYKYIPNYINKY